MLLRELVDPTSGKLYRPVFECRDRYGEISIHQMGQIIVSQFVGPCGITIVSQYIHALDSIMQDYNGKPWGYLSISSAFEAATDDAVQALGKSFHRCQQYGCVADAYVIKSAVGQKQVKAMRESFTTHNTFTDILFDNFDHAFLFLLDAINKRT